MILWLYFMITEVLKLGKIQKIKKNKCIVQLGIVGPKFGQPAQSQDINLAIKLKSYFLQGKINFAKFVMDG